MSFSLSHAPRERNNPDSYKTAGTVFRRPPPLFERHPLAGGGMSPSTQSLLFYMPGKVVCDASGGMQIFFNIS